MENQYFPQQNGAMNDWSQYVNQSVKVSALDGKSYEGIMEHIDGEQLHLLIPIDIPAEDGRAFGYPGAGGYPGAPGYYGGGYPSGYGYTGGYQTGFGYPGGGYGYPGGYGGPYGPYGLGYPGRPFGRLTLPLAALTALTVI
ncbi:hypothetical protein GCM10011391_32350 [Pullulanibacillus camelliae]|uniref:Uncharacterized protein n=1 Tax=Pullulanibacillus camelliae TaxID=1707096 RepID=A0A8J2YL09_9BACL|nr:hypothetical protein [Pullulanibacillus camelliae]GGE51093.1 hypothetical protein GCM10011391_32350 [Pullulanibacillus camelliae]